MNQSPDLAQRISDFAQFLRSNNLVVDPNTVVELHRVASLDYIQDRVAMRRASRSCICRQASDWHRFEALFDAYWQADGQPFNATPADQGDVENSSLSLAGQQRLLGMAGTSEKQRQEEEFFGAGDFKALSLADFRFVFDHRQMRELELLVERIARQARRRVCRRKCTSNHGFRIDVRKSLRQALRYNGQPVELRYFRNRRRLHRFVLLLDISQSMDVYARFFLRFARILMTVFQRSDAFVFNTDLNELARGHAQLKEEDFERVLNQHGKGWLGGTRIAQSFENFNENFLSRRVDSRTTVLIFSDGCDTDKPDRLARATETIQRRCGKLIWVNPLLGRFEAGEADPYMDPVVPFTDHYCSAHNVNTLIALERHMLS